MHYKPLPATDASNQQQEQGSVQAAETMRQMAENARESAKMAQETLAAIKNIVTLGQDLDETVTKFNPEKKE